MTNVIFFFKKTLALFMALVTLGGSIGGFGGSSAVMIAHRGYSGKYPENTALAFEEAAKHGSGGAETDIRRTKDGVYVTSHDSNVAFNDGSVMTVEDHTYAELTAKPLKNKKTRDTVYLCQLKEYLEIMRDHGMVCFVELKGEYTEEQVKEIFRLVDEVYALEKCILQSFDFDNLVKAKSLFPDLPVMLTYGSEDTDYERCFAYNISIDANLKLIDKKMINAFHERGLLVAAYTANDPFSLCYAKSYDLDFIESDYYA